jgi:hypothetical protein
VPDPEPGVRDALAVPFLDSKGHAFAVLELARITAAEPFRPEDASRLEDLAHSLSAALEAWFRLSCSCRRERGVALDAACCPPGSPS